MEQEPTKKRKSRKDSAAKVSKKRLEESSDEEEEDSDQVFHGDLACQNRGCKNKAYWNCSNSYLCGVHSKSQNREALPKRNSQQKRALKQGVRDEENEIIENARLMNQKAGIPGKVTLHRMGMRKALQTPPGFLRVFPNFRHQNREDGYGCSNLSPMSMGPIQHGQPNVPSATNLENFHQGSKCFVHEAEDGEPNEEYYANRDRMFQDATPHRHKFEGAKKQKPLYFVWLDGDGKEHHLDYVSSRQFYCNYYERFASASSEFLHLKKLIEEGTNLVICGYDAFDMSDPEKDYLNPKHPFGHERVLLTMLMKDEEEYPWRKHKQFEF
eukprot:TRINITY_DN6587_c1_g1_i1.p1 TRINITY_DN6587_c1_g1~~TRINITY_DN6587_c1_g1_i1.p1  ORF type:complete len:333 (+),score=76.34 TRINITY_DN6587_c1_g1_i1:24-1001(+)